MSRRAPRRFLAGALGVVLLLAPQPAKAHAAFVSAEPPPGAELASAPGAVVLTFTEPLNVGLSRATVTDPTGARFDGVASTEREIRVILRTNAPGIYLVEWTTVSTVDGHTLHGSFRFGVGVAPGPGGEAETGTAPQPLDLAIAAARAVEFAGLLLAIGILLLGRLSRRQPELPWAQRSVRVPLTVAFGAGLAVVVGESMAAAPSPSFEAIGAYLGTGLPGLARLVRLGAEALAVGAAVNRARLTPWLIGAALAGLAASGHAAAVRPAWFGIGVDALHLLAAGLWAGGIMALALVRPPGGWRSEEARLMLDRFTPVALPAFLVTVGLGFVRGLQELASLSDLVGTSYGQVLLAKIVGVVAMVPFSIAAWRRFAPTPRREAILGLVVVGAAALLAAFPLPPGRLAEAEEAGRPRASGALPGERDLTLGGEAGETLVGLTLRPARSGQNEVLVYLMPLGGSSAASQVDVALSVGQGPAKPMERCGQTCRRSTVALEGGERVGVEVAGRGGGTASFILPSLPAPDGTDLVERMTARMHELTTYRLDEVLRPAQPPVRATYAFRAPNRMQIRLSTGAETVIVGDTRYRRDGPGAPWQEDSALPLDVPSFIWDGPFKAARLVETEQVGDTPLQVVSFLSERVPGTPIWFRLWVDREGLVHRAHMRALGHFMDHRYFAFDQPVDILPPEQGGS
jgi:copper transport protein